MQEEFVKMAVTTVHILKNNDLFMVTFNAPLHQEIVDIQKLVQNKSPFFKNLPADATKVWFPYHMKDKNTIIQTDSTILLTTGSFAVYRFLNDKIENK